MTQPANSAWLARLLVSWTGAIGFGACAVDDRPVWAPSAEGGNDAVAGGGESDGGHLATTNGGAAGDENGDGAAGVGGTSGVAAIVDAECQPITADEHTVVLDHFDGDIEGVRQGAGLIFAASSPGLGTAGVFGPGSFVRYDLKRWTLTGVGAGEDPTNQGTIEFCINATSRGLFFEFNWNTSSYYPPAGHALQLGIWEPGQVQYNVWNFERCEAPADPCYPQQLIGTSILPLTHWQHVAITWSPTRSVLYVNGIAERVENTNVYADQLGWHAYLNPWGIPGFSGLIDEFHISQIARTDEEIRVHAGTSP